MPNLLEKVRFRRFLFPAWDRVKARGLRSPSAETHAAIRRFERQQYRNLLRIQRQLGEERFRFSPGYGLPIKRAERSPRPIVLQDVESRIVQRSLLDVLMDIVAVNEALYHPQSFGGIPGRGIEDAIAVAAEAVATEKARYFIRSDIENFFGRVPRARALETLANLLPDRSLKEFLREATIVELRNREELGHLLDFFPDETTGVAQGNSLSALLGNLLLRDFDVVGNSGQSICLRYLDDFLILSPNKQDAHATLASCNRVLSGLGMRAYRSAESKKAAEGSAQRTFTFLGCEISRGFVRPSAENIRRLIDNLRRRVELSRRAMLNGEFGSKDSYKLSLTATLSEIGRSLKAWSEQYSFCNYEQIQANIDHEIDVLLSEIIGVYSSRKDAVSIAQRRRMLGVWRVQDAKRAAIFGRSGAAI